VTTDVAAIAVRGVWLKHTYPGSPPLPERNPPPDNRWQRGDVVDALYLADSEETAWAEWYRHLAERMIPPLAQLPRELWTWKVEVEVADLSTPEQLAAVGLSPPAPGRRSWPSCQRLGERLWREGWPGLLAPSAARPAGQILCLFRDGPRLHGAEPLPPPRRIAEPPPPPIGLQT
jgi:RES domain-containing protein